MPIINIVFSKVKTVSKYVKHKAYIITYQENKKMKAILAK